MLLIWSGGIARSQVAAQTAAPVLPPLDVPIAADSVHYLFDPRPMHPGSAVMNLGLSLSLLPEPIVEQEIPAPAIDFQWLRGLSNSFSFYGTFSTNYFTNVLIAGIRYNGGDDGLSYCVGNAFAGFVGYIDLGGEFDKNTAAAVADIPRVEIGHKFSSVMVSLSASGDYVIYADTHVGSLEDKGLSSHFNDAFVTLAIEQPFYGQTRVTTGLSVGYSRTPYQIWMLYNVFDQYLVIPEFFFSFQL